MRAESGGTAIWAVAFKKTQQRIAAMTQEAIPHLTPTLSAPKGRRGRVRERSGFALPPSARLRGEGLGEVGRKNKISLGAKRSAAASPY
jgi:hypothetical protein